MLQVLLAVHLQQLKEIREGKRSYQQPQNPEPGDPGECAKERHEGVDMGVFPVDHWLDDVSDIADDDESPESHQERVAAAMIERQRDGTGCPDQATADHG